MPGVIIPRKTVLELRKLVEEGERGRGPNRAERDQDTRRHRRGGADLQLIDGTFPDYDRVIPSNNDKILEVDCKSFAEAVGPGIDDLDREKPRGEARDRERKSRRLGDQPRERHCRRGARSPLSGEPTSRSASIPDTVGHRRADRWRGRAIRDVGCRLADHRARQRRGEAPSSADADAGVTWRSAPLSSPKRDLVDRTMRVTAWNAGKSHLQPPYNSLCCRGTGSQRGVAGAVAARVGVDAARLTDFRTYREARLTLAPHRWC